MLSTKNVVAQRPTVIFFAVLRKKRIVASFRLIAKKDFAASLKVPILCNIVAKVELMRKKADFMGVWASFACLIHCLLTPLVSVGMLMSPALWHDLEWVFAIISILAVVMVHRSGISKQDSYLLIGSLVILLGGIYLEHYIHGAIYAVMATGLFIAFIHVKRLWKSSFFHKVAKEKPDLVKKAA